MSWLAPKNATSAVKAATVQIESRGDTKPSAAIAPATRICVTSIQPRRLPGRQPGKRGT